jgi:hypothetical protein
MYVPQPTTINQTPTQNKKSDIHQHTSLIPVIYFMYTSLNKNPTFCFMYTCLPTRKPFTNSTLKDAPIFFKKNPQIFSCRHASRHAKSSTNNPPKRCSPRNLFFKKIPTKNVITSTIFCCRSGRLAQDASTNTPSMSSKLFRLKGLPTSPAPPPTPPPPPPPQLRTITGGC